MVDEREENLQEFRRRIKNNPNLNKYNPNDLHRAELEDWWLESFLNSRSNDMDIASAVFFECLKWRQNFGVHTIGLLELRVVLEQSFIYFRGSDVEENRILWINFKNYTPNEYINMRLLIYWLERHTTDTENQPISIFFNFHEATPHSMDIQFIKFIFNSLKYYYPDCMRQIYVFELPLKLSAPWRLICSYLDSQTYSEITNLTSRNISTYIQLKYIPKEFGGDDEFVFKIEELARCTGSPLTKMRRFSHPLANDRKPSSSDKPLKKRSVKFDFNSMDLNDVSIFNRTLDWQYRTFMAVAPKRSLMLTYDSTNTQPAVNLVLQSMSAWYVYFNIGINSRRQVEIVPDRGLLDPNGRIVISVKTKGSPKSPRKYKIEVLATRLRDIPENLNLVDIYNEAAEDRVKFYYDCFVNLPQRNSIEQNGLNGLNGLNGSSELNGTIKQSKIKSSSPKEMLLPTKNIHKLMWKDRQIFIIIILFDIFLVAVVIYIYS